MIGSSRRCWIEELASGLHVVYGHLYEHWVASEVTLPLPSNLYRFLAGLDRVRQGRWPVLSSVVATEARVSSAETCILEVSSQRPGILLLARVRMTSKWVG